MLHWTWAKNGRPTLSKIEPHHKDLTLTTQGQDEKPPTTITRCDTDTATRILGVYLSPDGDFSTQLKILKKKADTFAHRLRLPRLTPQDILTFHRTTYGPSMRYVLPSLAVDEEELNTVQVKILSAMLNKLGHTSKLSTEIRHGPIEMGGLALIDLRTELGISQLKYLRDSIFSDSSESGKLIIMSLKYSQIEAGIVEPLLEHPSIHLPYLTPSWLTSVRQYLYQHTLTVSITDSLRVILRGQHDQCIISSPLLTHYTATQKTDIILVRLHLQVITLSDMLSPDGTNACPHHIMGLRRPHQVIRQKKAPTRQGVTITDKTLETIYLLGISTIQQQMAPISNHQPSPNLHSSATNRTPIPHDKPLHSTKVVSTSPLSLPTKMHRHRTLESISISSPTHHRL